MHEQSLTFSLTIELGNDAMQSGHDLAAALRHVASVLDGSCLTPGESMPPGTIRDLNGNRVRLMELRLMRSRGAQCQCGCGQKTAATMRLRRLTCDSCGYPCRTTRTWIEQRGCQPCACGGLIVPDCLEDRAHLPGAEGEQAWREMESRNALPF